MTIGNDSGLNDLDGEGAAILTREGAAHSELHPLAPPRTGLGRAQETGQGTSPLGTVGGNPDWVSIGSKATFARAKPFSSLQGQVSILLEMV